MMTQILQIDYDRECNRLTWNGYNITAGDVYDVLLPDNAGGGIWRRIRVERHDSGYWYVVDVEGDGFGVPYSQPIGLWAREVN